MHLADRNNLGWLAIRDHDTAKEIDLRDVPGVVRLIGWSDSDKPLVESPGDLCGGTIWDALPGERLGMSAGFWSGPGVVSTPPSGGTSTGGSWSLLRAPSQPDTRLERKNLARPSWALGTLPKGWTGLASAGTEETQQAESLHPDFLGLVAPQRHGPSSAGTYVYDLRDDGSPDPTRAAQLQQAWRVSNLGSEGLCGFTGMSLALQLGVEDLDVKAGGLPMAEGRSVGLGSWLAGGPFTVGVGLCQHVKAGPDGHLSPLHLQTGALFLGGGRDGPLDFRGQIDVGTADEDGFWQRVHLDWDPEAPHPAGCQFGFGKWRWRVKIPHFVGEPPPPPPRQPPPGDEFPPPGGGQPDDPTGLIFNPFPPQPGGLVIEDGLGDGAKTGGVVSDGTKPVYASSPFCQSSPGYTFRPQDPTTGATMASDDPSGWYDEAPLVGGFFAFGAQTGGEWIKDAGNAFSHATGQGGVMLLPGDVDAFAVARGEDVTTNYPTQIALPTGLSSLALGAINASTGVVGTGMAVTAGTGGRLDFQTLDADGNVTATAYIPSGSTGDITGGGGGGTFPGSSVDGNLVSFDGTGGSTFQDSGIASADVLAVSSDGPYAFVQRDSGDTAFESRTDMYASHDTGASAYTTTAQGWNNPAHTIEHTGNNTLSANVQDLCALEIGMPNHTFSGGSSGTGGTGLKFTGQLGTNTGALTGRRGGSTRGNLFLGGGNANGINESLACYSGGIGAFVGIEGQGVVGIADTLASDPTWSSYFSDDRPGLMSVNGDLKGRHSGGDAFKIGANEAPGDDVVLQTSDDGTIAGMSGDTATANVPGSGSGSITIPTPFQAGIVHNIVLIVDTALGTTGGLTGFQLGDGTDDDRFGVASATAINTALDRDDWTVPNEQLYGFYVTTTQAGSLDVIIKPIGGDWDGTGSFTVVFQQQFTTFASY